MSEPNLYQPPESVEPQKGGPSLKRAIGGATVVVLTPVALVLALLISCGAGATLVDATRMLGWKLPAWAAEVIISLPPLCVVVAIAWWLVHPRRRKIGTANVGISLCGTQSPQFHFLPGHLSLSYDGTMNA